MIKPRVDTPEGEWIKCYKLSFTQCLKIIFTGKIWIHLLTFKDNYKLYIFTTKKEADISSFDYEK